MNKLLESKIFAKQPFYTLSKPLNKLFKSKIFARQPFNTLLQNKMLYHKNGNNESENKKYIVNPFKIQSRSTPLHVLMGLKG